MIKLEYFINENLGTFRDEALDILKAQSMKENLGKLDFIEIKTMLCER